MRDHFLPAFVLGGCLRSTRNDWSYTLRNYKIGPCSKLGTLKKYNNNKKHLSWENTIFLLSWCLMSNTLGYVVFHNCCDHFSPVKLLLCHLNLSVITPHAMCLHKVYIYDLNGVLSSHMYNCVSLLPCLHRVHTHLRHAAPGCTTQVQRSLA